MSRQEEDGTLGMLALAGPGAPIGAVHCAAEEGRRTAMSMGP